MTNAPNVEAMAADTRPGCCIACDAPLPAGRRRICGEPACLRLYQQVYQADRNAADAASRRARVAHAPAIGEIRPQKGGPCKWDGVRWRRVTP